MAIKELIEISRLSPVIVAVTIAVRVVITTLIGVGGISAVRVAVAIAIGVIIATLVVVSALVATSIVITTLIAASIVIPALIGTLIAVLLIVGFLSHERVRVLADLVANSRMLLQIFLQSRMALQEFAVQHQVWLFAKLLSSFTMAIEEAVELGHIAAIAVTAAAIIVAALIVLRFLRHERIRVLADLITNSRVLLQIFLEGRMALQESVVQHQVRLFTKLVGSFAMAIEEPIEPGNVAKVAIAIAIAVTITVAVSAIAILVSAFTDLCFRRHEGIWIFAHLIAHFRMLR
ncbi:MAG: hypothetical protein WAL95_11690 [Candidatus Acidiferrales bacterium]